VTGRRMVNRRGRRVRNPKRIAGKRTQWGGRSFTGRWNLGWLFGKRRFLKRR